MSARTSSNSRIKLSLSSAWLESWLLVRRKLPRAEPGRSRLSPCFRALATARDAASAGQSAQQVPVTRNVQRCVAHSIRVSRALQEPSCGVAARASARSTTRRHASAPTGRAAPLTRKPDSRMQCSKGPRLPRATRVSASPVASGSGRRGLLSASAGSARRSWSCADQACLRPAQAWARPISRTPTLVAPRPLPAHARDRRAHVAAASA